MQVRPTSIPDVLIVEPTVFGDARGFFYESFNARKFAELTGLNPTFVQDNHSRSAKNVLRGLHYQVEQSQGKLISVTNGEIFDVAVDLRRESATFGKWTSARLSAENHLQLWIPQGFAHGFLVLSESADVLYKVTDYWAAKHERCVAWDDPTLAVDWPLSGAPLVSQKDEKGLALSEAEPCL